MCFYVDFAGSVISKGPSGPHTHPVGVRRGTCSIAAHEAPLWCRAERKVDLALGLYLHSEETAVVQQVPPQ